MSQKPVDKRSPLETRTALWAAIRGYGAKKTYFTAREIRMETCCSQSQVVEALAAWSNAGYLSKEIVPHCGTVIAQYTLERDAIAPPRVRRDGSAITQGNGVKNMWRTMKKMGEFTARALAIESRTETVNVSNETAAEYCQSLKAAGYLVVLQPGKVTGGKTLYRFNPAMNTGPLPPQIQRTKQIWDPNIEKVVWTDGSTSLTDQGGSHEHVS